MPEFPITTPRRLVAALKRMGFYEVRQKGSHLRLERGNLQVTIPMHSRDIGRRLLRSILRQAHLSLEEVRKEL